MEHAKYRKLLERHLDDELVASEREQLFEHLETCEECRQILEAEERLADRLNSIPRLVAPSDLRARILQDVSRDRERLMHALDDESRFAKAVRGRAGEEDDDEEYPYFAGSTPARRRSRFRAFWVRYSPVAAILFAAIAGITALLTSDSANIGPLAGVQATVRNVARAMGDAVVAAVAPSRAARRASSEESLVASAATAPPPSAPVQVEIAQSRPSADNERHTGSHPGVGSPVQLPELMAAPAREMRAALHHMARAASVSLPEPAEQALPATAAIAVTASSNREILSLDPDEYGSALREAAETRLGGSLTGVDQFAFDGHRYRCYTLRVSGDLFEHLVHSLETYRAPSDNTILQVFRDQGYGLSESDSVVFVAASAQQLRSAAHAIREDPARKTAEYRNVKVLIVE
jgi:hypothetical protein